MMVSTKGRYALRVMIDLAEHDREKYIPLKEVAQRQDISEKYLEVIIKSLARAHYVEGLRGKGGGYRLTREPSQYTIAEILRVTEGSLAPVSCLEDDPNVCPRAATCQTLPLWEGLNKVVSDYLTSKTLEDLLNNSNPADNYVI